MMTVYVTPKIIALLESWNIRWNSGHRFTDLGYGRVNTYIEVSLARHTIYRGYADSPDLCGEATFIAWFHNSFLPEAIISCHARRIPC
jgi:hypothetical protein